MNDDGQSADWASLTAQLNAYHQKWNLPAVVMAYVDGHLQMYLCGAADTDSPEFVLLLVKQLTQLYKSDSLRPAQVDETGAKDAMLEETDSTEADYLTEETSCDLESKSFLKDDTKAVSESEATIGTSFLEHEPQTSEQKLTQIEIKFEEADEETDSDITEPVSEAEEAFCSDDPSAVKRSPAESNDPARPFACLLCSLNFPNKWNLKNHLLVHSSRKPHACDYCGKTFKRAYNKLQHETYIHQASQSERCLHCHAAFRNKRLLSDHVLQHHSHNKTRFQCELCSKGFKRMVELKRHMTNHTGEKEFTCVACGKSFSSKAYLQLHMATHSAERLHACRVCGKRFKQQSHRGRHEKLHGSKAVYCNICHRVYNSDHLLGLHYKLKHMSGEGSHYECGKCSASFESYPGLNEHTKSEHFAADEGFRCQFCTQDHTDLTQMLEHQDTHQGPLRYTCLHCGKTFKTRILLDRHVRIHTGEKPYECQTCHKRFTTAANMTQHEKIHASEDSYLCQFCHKSFRHYPSLKTHERNHQGIQPFPCSLCDKTFTHRRQALKHEATHSSPQYLDTFEEEDGQENDA